MGRDQAGVISAFRRQFALDREQRREVPLKHYQRVFGGFEDAIAEEYARLVAESAAAAEAARVSPAGGDGAPGPDAAPPRTIGTYRLLHEIGRGGQAVVYLAEDTRLKRRVALKVFAPGLLASENLVARFRREAEAASRLDHPGICTVFEAGIDGETPYIAMRHIEGRSLAEWIESSRAQQGEHRRTSSLELPAPPGAAAGTKPSLTMRIVLLIEKAARALHAAHEAGLVHRDVKPGNVMVTSGGEPVLLDFGLARDDEGGQTLTLTGALLGTPAYMAPEQLLAQHLRIDRRTDVYSLGVTLYECLTLKRPFDAPTRDALYQQILSSEAESPRRLNAQIPRDLEVVLATAMEKNRERRYGTALDFAEDLRRVRELEPIRARPTPRVVRVARWAQRHPATATAAAAVFLLLAGGLLVTTHFLSVSREAHARTSKALLDRSVALGRARVLALRNASAAAIQADPMRALLLAQEAVRLDPGRESMDQLRLAIYHSRERAVLRGHQDVLLTSEFSPKGDAILTASHDDTARLWDLSGKPTAVLRGHAGNVHAASFSPDGKLVVTAGEDATARLWDLSGKEVAVLRGHEKLLHGAAFSPAGDRILTWSQDATARLWDLSGRQLAVLPHRGMVLSGAFSPTGERIATCSDDRTACLWDLAGGKLATCEGHTSRVWRVIFSPDGSRIVTTSADSTGRVWDLAGKELAVFRGHTSEVGPVAFSADRTRIATSGWDARVCVWDIEGRSIATLTQGPSPARSLSWSPRDDLLVVGLLDGTVLLWRPEEKDASILCRSIGEVAASTFSPDGSLVQASFSDGTAHVWAVDECELAALPGHHAPVYTATYSPKGDRILTGSLDGTARLWSAAGDPIAVFRHEAEVSDAAFSPRGDLIATGGGREAVARVWDLTGREVAAMRGHTRYVSDVEFSPDGARLVSASWDGTARLWGIDGTLIATMAGHTGEVSTACFSPSGAQILTASYDWTLRLWDAAGSPSGPAVALSEGVVTASFSPAGDRILCACFGGHVCICDLPGRAVHSLRTASGYVHGAVYSPQGDLILAVPADPVAKVWSAEGVEVAALRGHESNVVFACFSRDGRRVATTSTDATARLWDPSGRQFGLLRGPAHGVVRAAFSPDGKNLLTSASDGSVRLWLVDDADVLALAKARTTREFTEAEREQYADLLGEDNAQFLASRRAAEAVRRLGRDAVLVSEIAERVEADPLIDDDTRAAALSLLAERKDDPAAINRATWDVVKAPGRQEAEYALALRRLEVAARIAHDDGFVTNSYGVALYRAGKYDEALATLTRADAINSKAKPPGIVEDVAFLAMSAHRLGRTGEAHRHVARLRELMRVPALASGPDAALFLREAEALAGGD